MATQTTIAAALQDKIDAKAAIKTAIEAKGVTVGAVKLSDYAAKIGEIENYEPEVLMYKAGLVTALSQAQISRLDTLAKALKTGLGVTRLSQVFDVFYIFAAETEESAIRNFIKKPHDCVTINSPTFTQYEGFRGNGSSSYLIAYYNPYSQGSAYALNSASLGVYRRAWGSMSLIGCQNGTMYIAPNYVGLNNSHRATLNSGEFYDYSSGFGELGMVSICRTNATTHVNYMNGSKVNEKNVASTSIPNANLQILSVSGQYSSSQVSMAFCGKGFSDAEINTIFICFEAYMDSLGKGVV